jgi:hypothetical protein
MVTAPPQIVLDEAKSVSPDIILHDRKLSGPEIGRSYVPLRLRRLLIGCAASFSGAVGIAYISAALFGVRPLTNYFFRTQDASAVIAIAALLAAGAFFRFSTTLPAVSPSSNSRLARLAPWMLAAFVFLCGAIGSSLVFDNFHLSRDEFLAEFDALIFRSGHLIAPIDLEWRPFAQSLAPRFMLPIAHNLGFVSAYLPGNAFLRAVVGMWGDSDLTGAILTAMAIVFAYGVSRRLWPQRNDVSVLVPLLIATSSQTLITAMTSYAMCAHLALNLVWLWLFLRDEKWTHAGAMLVGALASGLHQVIFHPLFVAPFIISLWFKGRRQLALVYAVVYTLICLFWISYPQLALYYSGMESNAPSGAGVLDFLSRSLVQLVGGEYNPMTVMLMNVLRFISWQNPFILPLAFLAYRPIRKGTGISRELAAGLFLTLGVMTVGIAYQGEGWGYRYVHGLIGSMALLAAYGWIDLTSCSDDAEATAARMAVAITSVFAVFILFPVHALQAHDFAAPYAKASAIIASAPTDVVIVDQTGLRFGEDLVRNDPLLRNKPKVLDLTTIDKADLSALCQHYSISLFDSSQGRPLGIGPDGVQAGDGHNAREKLRIFLKKISCGRQLALAPH